jgi:hypothetical protein
MSFYIFTAPLYKRVVKSGAILDYRGEPRDEKDYVTVPDMDINKNLTKWLNANPGFVPYGETKIINNDMILQLFIKYESKLNDKFLQLFLEELKLIPETGTAYNQALENFNEISKRQLGIISNDDVPQVSSSSSTGRGGRRRNKTNKNKTKRNKTRRNK